MQAPSYVIRRTSGEDWQQVRDLRVEMIKDTPEAFGDSLEKTLAYDEQEWRGRGERGVAEHGTVVVAITDSGEWIGTMGCYIPDEQTGPLLVGVYVNPRFRGAQLGVSEALLEQIEDWARTEANTLTLHVHEDNLRAQKFYERHGFTSTGHQVPYNLDPAKNELEMVKQL